MKKRILAIILALTMVASVFAATTLAVPKTVEPLGDVSTWFVIKDKAGEAVQTTFKFDDVTKEMSIYLAPNDTFDAEKAKEFSAVCDKDDKLDDYTWAFNKVKVTATDALTKLNKTYFEKSYDQTVNNKDNLLITIPSDIKNDTKVVIECQLVFEEEDPESKEKTDVVYASAKFVLNIDIDCNHRNHYYGEKPDYYKNRTLFDKGYAVYVCTNCGECKYEVSDSVEENFFNNLTLKKIFTRVSTVLKALFKYAQGETESYKVDSDQIKSIINIFSSIVSSVVEEKEP